jgi:hypothetical protein
MYYTDLYMVVPKSAAKGGTKAQVFACIRDRFSAEMKDPLKRLINLDKLS